MLAAALLGVTAWPFSGWCQTPVVPGPVPSNFASAEAHEGRIPGPANDSVLAWEGLSVRSISFQGVSADRLEPLADHLAQAEGAPLTSENVKKSLRQLYATGLYDTIEVEARARPDGVALVFRWNPADVYRDGGRRRRHGRHHEYAVGSAPASSRPDTRLTQAKMSSAHAEQMRATLEENGYHEPVIAQA